MTFPRSILRHSAAPLGALALLSATAALAQTGPTLPAAYTTAYFYDAGGRLTGVIRPNPGDVSSPVYLATRNQYATATGNLAEVDTGALSSWPAAGVAPAQWTGFTVNQVKTYTYDSMGRKLTEELFDGNNKPYELTQYSYDAMGRQQCVAIRMNPTVYTSLPASACTLGTAGSYGPDRITYTTYDSTNRPLTIQRAYGTSLQETYETFTYTGNHLPHTLKDANNNLTTLSYDGLDHLSETQFPSKTSPNTSSTTDFELYPSYDGNDNRLTLQKRDNTIINYTYDALNRLTLKHFPAAPSTDVYYGYDNRNLQLFANFTSATGQGVQTTYDGFSQVLTSTINLNGTTQQLSYRYDADGNRTRITHPDTNYFVYGYDGLDRLTQIAENGTTTIVGLAYDTQGRRNTLTRGGGTTTTTYGYDPVSRLQTLALNLNNSSTYGETLTFSYSPSSQIATRNLSNSIYSVGPLSNSSTTYTPNGLNQYTQIVSTTTANPTYDPNGNLTFDGATTFVYDAENRLTSASGAHTATLTYDPKGRLYKTGGGSNATTQFLYDGDELVAEYNGSGTLLRRYVHGSSVDEPLVWYEGATVGASTRRYLHADHQGSIVAVTDSGGNNPATDVYDPYGSPPASANNQGRFQYTGQINIPEIGLYYYKARIYDASLGRFMQTDPVGYKDDMDLYAYVYNDPIGKTDPTGEDQNGLAPGGLKSGDDCGNGASICYVIHVNDSSTQPAAQTSTQTPAPNSTSDNDPDTAAQETPESPDSQLGSPNMEASRHRGGQGQGERGRTGKAENPGKGGKVRPNPKKPGGWLVKDDHTGKWIPKPPGWQPKREMLDPNGPSPNGRAAAGVGLGLVLICAIAEPCGAGMAVAAGIVVVGAAAMQ